MDTEERGLERDQVDVAEFPSSKSSSWRGWLLKFLSTAEQLNWNYQTCCQMMSETFRGAVFNAFLETKLSAEVELGDSSVIDVLSRTSEVIGVSQIKLIEEVFFWSFDRRKKKISQTMHEGWAHSRRLPWKHSVMSIGPPIICQA